MNTGNPDFWRPLWSLDVSASPRRASSDRAWPRDTDLALAMLLAAASRSLSMVNVVLMPESCQ